MPLLIFIITMVFIAGCVIKIEELIEDLKHE
jgi:hypothetical protein